MITIGITGHRQLADTERVKSGLDKVLHHIQTSFPGRTLTLLSSLAEGADRLVAHRVLSLPDSKLEVPLPMPVKDYEKDFASEESQREFRELIDSAEKVIPLPARSTREEAYAAAGMWILDHADVLIAIWDGENGHGPGGTAEIVAEARERRMPMAWIHAGDSNPGVRMMAEAGHRNVTFENL